MSDHCEKSCTADGLPAFIDSDGDLWVVIAGNGDGSFMVENDAHGAASAHQSSDREHGDPFLVLRDNGETFVAADGTAYAVINDAWLPANENPHVAAVVASVEDDVATCALLELHDGGFAVTYGNVRATCGAPNHELRVLESMQTFDGTNGVEYFDTRDEATARWLEIASNTPSESRAEEMREAVGA